MLRNLCLHFARQDGHDGKKQKRRSSNLTDLNTKNQKTKIWYELPYNLIGKNYKILKCTGKSDCSI